jgi:tetratricopeptide (TPR) repeat protein
MLSRVDNAAHVGGLVTGLILGALIAKAAPDSNATMRRVGVLALGIVLIGGGTAWWLHSRDYMRHMQRGVGYLAQNKTDQAIAEFQTVIRQRPNYPSAHFRLAQAYIRKNDFANAEAELGILIAMAPEDARASYLLGFLYLQEGKPPQASNVFQKILAQDPKDANAHYGLGAASLAESKYEQAIAEYKLAAQLNPELEGVYYNLGRTQAKLSLFDDAIASYRKELDSIGDDYDVEMALASAYDAKGMKKEAADARQKAADLTGKK